MHDLEPDLYRELANRLNTQVDARAQPDEIPQFDGAIYRLIFTGMEITGLAPQMRIGDVRLSQHVGPILSHVTDLRQRAGFPLLFDKSMDREVEVGHGQWLTVCAIPVALEAGEVPVSLRGYRERAEAAAALLAVVLDERVAHTPLAEDLILTLGGERVAAQDVAENIRSYLPYSITQTETATLAEELDPSDEIGLALRWYLRGAQVGPGKDGVVFMWIAIEALVSSDHPKAIEARLSEVGWDLAHLGLGIGEIFGVRSRVVHATESSKPLADAMVRQAFLDAEAMARVLLRDALDLGSTWPAAPDANMFLDYWRQTIGETWLRPPAVVWHPPPLPAVSGSLPPDLAWGEILPASEPPGEVVIDGGTVPQRHRLRRWIGMAMAFFSYDDPVSWKIRSIDGNGRASAEGVEIASALLEQRDPISEIRLGFRVHVLFASQLLFQAGVGVDSILGALLHGFLGGWARHRAFVVENQLGEELLVLQGLDKNTPLSVVGEHLGAVAAGSTRSEPIVKSWFESTDIPGAVEISTVLISLGQNVSSAQELLDALVAVSRGATGADDGAAA